MKADSRASPVASVIVPAYNEEAGIGVVLQKLFGILDERCEVIVVDDGSTDNTSRIASKFPCRLIVSDNNRGKCEAVKMGIREAKGNSLIFIDADDTYPVEAIPELMHNLENDYDMVVGVREHGVQNIPVLNRIGNYFFKIILWCSFGCKTSDPLTGLYGIKRAHLLRMGLESRGFGVEAEIAIKASVMDLRIAEVPIQYRERLGKAKLRPLKDGCRIIWTILAFLPRLRPRLFWVAVTSSLALLLAAAIGIVRLSMA